MSTTGKWLGRPGTEIILSVPAFLLCVLAVSNSAWASPPYAVTKDMDQFMEVGHTCATMRGELNPRELAATGWFEWFPAQDFNDTGATATIEKTNPEYAGAGNQLVPMSGRLDGLKPNSIYGFRFVAKNKDGTTSGDTKHFFTTGKPDFATGTTTPTMKPDTVMVRGTVTPYGRWAAYYFEYAPLKQISAPGKKGLYDKTPLVMLKSSWTPLPCSATLSNLSPDTVYSYRIRVNSPSGVYIGDPKTFQTAKTPTPQVIRKDLLKTSPR